ncbi:magnesium-translocating P-type ATPase [Pollutibacter soli]|uniref:magnesium-translocating P-type ATPase n=1 Tax=Pollutibacter soli TaxID=3034157 RepID=UPI0030139A7A
MEYQTLSGMPLESLFIQLNTSTDGLTSEEATNRLKKNPVPGHSNKFYKNLHLLVRQFTSPLTLLLVVAVVISSLLNEYSDSLIILLILLASGMLGFWQEVKAGNAADRLRNMVKMKHTVLRDKRFVQVISDKIVPGDMIILDAGDMIPGDCRIIESDELHVNETALTGEPLPVAKIAGHYTGTDLKHKNTNCLWKGTNVISGTAKALVVYTGSDTMLGRIIKTIDQSSATAFEKDISRYGVFLLKVSVVLSAIILIVNLLFQKSIVESLLFSLALAVGMAPELLPAIISLSMSVGAKNLMKKKVIVKKLTSVFNLGEATILCTDKTGTITEGKMNVKSFVDAAGNPDESIGVYASLNSVFQQGYTNPIDLAITSLSLDISGYRKTDEIPFDFNRKRISIAVQHLDEHFFVTKGAFKEVLEICSDVQISPGVCKSLTEEFRGTLQKQFTSWSGEGYRILGLATKKMSSLSISRADEKEMTFLGFILMEDPLKKNIQESIKNLKSLNISIKIISGDNRFAAGHTAKQLGIENPVIISGDDLRNHGLLSLNYIDVFAEVEPMQKEQIVKALQKSGATVAYIGDGINDVSAINAADVGISTDNAVDVAKDAADFILLEKDLSVLADGIYEGRKCFANSIKYILITTGATFGNMFSLSITSFFLRFLPMLPKQILLTNFITDMPFLAIASDHVDRESVSNPAIWDLKTVRKFMIVFGIHSSLFDMATFFIFYFLFRLNEPLFQTTWFLESVISEILLLFIIRTKGPLLSSKPGTLLIITSLAALCLLILSVLIPAANYLMGFVYPGNLNLTIVALILLAYVISGEMLKKWFLKHTGQTPVHHTEISVSPQIAVNISAE